LTRAADEEWVSILFVIFYFYKNIITELPKELVKLGNVRALELVERELVELERERERERERELENLRACNLIVESFRVFFENFRDFVVMKWSREDGVFIEEKRSVFFQKFYLSPFYPSGGYL